jgi:hypothetical protein
MKRLLWRMGLCTLLSACQRSGEGPEPAHPRAAFEGEASCAPPETLPRLQPGSSTALPLQGTTHLVAGLCASRQTLVVDGVDANSGAITFRIGAMDTERVQALLSQAQASGLPVAVYSTPVALWRQGDGGEPETFVDPCDLILGSQQGAGLPSGGGGPRGEERPEEFPDDLSVGDGGTVDPALARMAEAQRRFAELAVCSAQGFDVTVSAAELDPDPPRARE